VKERDVKREKHKPGVSDRTKNNNVGAENEEGIQKSKKSVRRKKIKINHITSKEIG
jgi:hypothetical protein